MRWLVEDGAEVEQGRVLLAEAVAKQLLWVSAILVYGRATVVVQEGGEQVRYYLYLDGVRE